MPPLLRRGLLIGTTCAIVALDVHLIGPYVTRATTALRHPSPGWAVVAFAAEIVSLLAAAQLQRRMLRAGGTPIPMPTAVGLTYASYAVSMSLPAGSAVSAGYTFRRMRQLGASMPAAGFALVSSGVLSALAYGVLAVAGVVVAGGSTGPAGAVVAVIAAAGLIALTRALLRSPEIVGRVGLRALRVVNRVLHRDPQAGVPGLRRSISTLASIHPTARDWALGTGAAVINWCADLACLFAACQAVGARGATIAVVLLAYLGGTSVSGISLVPGGVGVVDAALILILVQHDVASGPATAAVLLYRVLSLGFGLLAGWTAWIVHARHARPAQLLDAAALPSRSERRPVRRSSRHVLPSRPAPQRPCTRHAIGHPRRRPHRTIQHGPPAARGDNLPRTRR